MFFFTIPLTNFNFHEVSFILLSANIFNLELSNILSFEKELTISLLLRRHNEFLWTVKIRDQTAQNVHSDL